MSAKRLIIPVALWDKAPSHSINSIHITSNEKFLVTGGINGEICVWDISVAPSLNILPRYIIYGHSSSVLCIADGENQNSFVTSSDTGEMCLWNIEDGQCLVSKETQDIHTYMASRNSRLFCIGQYAEILVLEPTNFSVLIRLSSKDKPDWITAIHILQPPQLNNLVIIGLSIVGVVRIWTINDCSRKIAGPIYDNDSQTLNCYKSVQIISNPESMGLLLIVCAKQWSIYDATDFLKLTTVEASGNEQWTGGNFVSRNQVLIWSNIGISYLYTIATKRCFDNKTPSSTKLRCRFITTIPLKARQLNTPKFRLISLSNNKFIVRGDLFGTVSAWAIKSMTFPDNPVVDVEPTYLNSLEKSWQFGIDIKPSNKEPVQITACVYLPSLRKVALAQTDGTIKIEPIVQFAFKNLSPASSLNELTDQTTKVIVLAGHEGQVSCLLYPNSVNICYDRSYLLSGGTDFSVCLWDVIGEKLLQKFCTQAGSITKIIAASDEFGESSSQSVCCIANDHSVSILSIKERKFIMVANRQLFPVYIVKWKPSEDLLFVGCVDGSVYVWKIESGLLLKVLQGLSAEETLSICEDLDVNKDEQTNSATEIFKSIKQGNLSAIKTVAAKSINQLASSYPQAKTDLSTANQSHPLTIQSLESNQPSVSGFVMLFDIESTISHLINDRTLVVEPFSILLSVFFSWGLDKEVCKISKDYTDLNKQLDPACIGILSQNYMSLLLPCHVKRIPNANKKKRFFSLNSYLTRLTDQYLSQSLFVPSSPSLLVAVFITTLAREILKSSNKNQSPRTRQAKTELLKYMDILINEMPLEVRNLILEVIDIILYCLDFSLLENRGLGVLFPSITRFHMVSYCSSTRRIAVGTVTGNLAIYELRSQSRPQIIQAHNSGVSACSFSTDGKYLASYSAGDNKLCFWLTTVSGLFGLGNVKIRCVGTIETPPITATLKNPLDELRVAKLIWFADKRVVLMLIDDRELCYQVT